METDKQPGTKHREKYYIDSTYIHRPREGVEMRHPLKDGLGKLWSELLLLFMVPY